MKISVVFGQWFGLSELTEDELKKLKPKAEAAVLKTALYFEGRVKKKLTGIRHGRTYWIGRGKRKRPHIASAPGEAPAVLTGKLRQSITHSDVRWEGDDAVSEVGSSVPYAARLEFGGVDSRGIRILPRPYFSATWLEEQDKMQSMLDEAVKGR
jgi:phage gpG-like protein